MNRRYTAVHPHARGAYEKLYFVDWQLHRFIPTHVGLTQGLLALLTALYGSSPRTWGLQITKPIKMIAIRFIPTHVGLTMIDHDAQDDSYGSSPRTWGLLCAS